MNKDISKREEQVLENVAEKPTVRPAVDIYENRDEYLVIADLPAVSKDRLDIRLDGSELTLVGVVGAEVADGALEREFPSVSFRRSFELPETVNRDKVAAELQHGVLTLHLPKVDAVKPKQIPVRSG